MRYILDGFFDRTQPHGTPNGSGPGWEVALSRFEERESRRKAVGTWRAVDAQWTRNDGSYIDPDYYIVDW